MNTSQMNIKIAEYLGWSKLTEGPYAGWHAQKDHIIHVQPSVVPDYFNSLDTIHAAERMLTDDQFYVFQLNLAQVVLASPCMCVQRKLWEATAAQRAEAFGKTLNLW